uniref:ATP synthase F0 subunit 8 n=1 Tax=Halosydna sp. YZ-2018 TaxID=2153331 RepID=A0A343W6A6_9ANNE|nr:ATP synthase F0 subunit 8 [Harmothoe imbricata]AVW86128.1 ATP synthase F0 subunit 8 [Halosydna sp. YZ-2018]WKB17955.1 ATP synthase F0 subunit 8 [Harmothoe imbricata]
MPHLSPLNWILSPFIFWLLLALFTSILWWSQSISFPKISSSLNYTYSNPWNW